MMEDVFNSKMRVLYKIEVWNTIKTHNTTRDFEKKKQRKIENQKELDYQLKHRNKLYE